ncbi:MAG: DUF1036 domain-containing protein [Alphaproteobacteria bacterium]|nr:DUF1036 domain-containing protein [Alphaproteobacteria bacterium]
MRLCNRTGYVVYAATATLSQDITTQGWTRIVPGQCRTAIDGDLAARAYYLYARSSTAHAGPQRAWSGTTDFCVKDTNFVLSLPQIITRCPVPDSFPLSFAPLDTHHMRSWTATFRESPDLDSMQNAEHAGLRRLLSDLGTRDTVSTKSFEAALAQFRKRLHLPANADKAALFDALETAASRAAAPSGYSVCNDTPKPVWAAIAFKKNNVFVSRGWWAVAAGGCAHMISEPVASTPVYLRVEIGKSPALVSGDEKFCVTTIEFEVQGRGHCAARGLTEAGFAVTNIQGAAGYAAHVSENGLASSTYAGTSK